MSLLSISKNNESNIEIQFDYDEEIVKKIRLIPGRKWIVERKAWCFPDNNTTNDALNKIFGTQIKDKIIINKNLHQNIIELEKIKMRNEMRIRGFSNKSIKTYTAHLNRYALYNKEFLTFNLEIVKEYLLYIRDFKECSISYLSQALCSIKFYYCKLYRLPETNFYIPFPKKEKKLPNVLSKEEVQKIISAVSNIKHRAMIMLIYSAGLRVSEAVSLKVEDIDSNRGFIHIRQSKGRKDRLTLLSNNALTILREYYKIYKPENWLFPGQEDGKHLNTRTIQTVFNKACKKAGISKNATLHWLRHSFGTHLLESGVDIRYIQELLGHQSSKTTEIYTHVSRSSLGKIKNPLDDIVVK